MSLPTPDLSPLDLRDAQIIEKTPSASDENDSREFMYELSDLAAWGDYLNVDSTEEKVKFTFPEKSYLIVHKS